MKKKIRKKKKEPLSMQVKEELSYVEGTSRHCKLAELAALVLCAVLGQDRKKMMVIKKVVLANVTESENETVLRKYFTFVQKHLI